MAIQRLAERIERLEQDRARHKVAINSLRRRLVLGERKREGS
jgi:hypothetical protein